MSTVQRLAHGIVDAHGQLVHRETGIDCNAAPSTETLARGMKALREGTKTDLLKLPISVLAEIFKKIANGLNLLPSDGFNKAQLVRLLLQFVSVMNVPLCIT